MGLLVLVKWYYAIGAMMFFFYSMHMIIIEKPVLEWTEIWHCKGNYYIRIAVLPFYALAIITMMPLVYGGAFFLCVLPQLFKIKP